MKVLAYDVVALALQREELEGDVDLALELLLEAVKLLVQEEAVGTEEVDIFNDLDRSVFEPLGRGFTL